MPPRCVFGVRTNDEKNMSSEVSMREAVGTAGGQGSLMNTFLSLVSLTQATVCENRQAGGPHGQLIGVGSRAGHTHRAVRC